MEKEGPIRYSKFQKKKGLENIKMSKWWQLEFLGDYAFTILLKQLADGRI